MISVVIPVLNESETIGTLVELVRRDPRVSEVLVIDDGSVDATPERARAAGAVVITSTLLGKGASMEDGTWAARNEVLLFLDGDLTGLCEDLVERMTGPVLAGEADFVKARFSRSAGRVTTLTARPLLRTFFPELARFDQPLGGIVAARRSLLRRLHFENDYGVDIGLFLDAAASGARLAEVDIGHLTHDSHPLENLGDMATQVVRVLLDRAARCGRLRSNQLRTAEEVDQYRQADLSTCLEGVRNVHRLALFDMDGTLLKGRFILSLARRAKRVAALMQFLDNASLTPEERTRRIAGLFAGVPRPVFEQVAREVPLMPGASETVVSLRKAGFQVGIVTDSFSIASEVVRRRVFADFSIAHWLRFHRGRATGQVMLAPAMVHPHGCPRHDYCKRNLLIHLGERLSIRAEQVLAVGDGENDVCLLKAAGQSVAFHPKTANVQAAARHVVHGSLEDVVRIVEEVPGANRRLSIAIPS